MRVERDILIDASPAEIWELVSNPDHYDRFWHDLTRLDRKNEEQGLGARFALRMRIGSADLGGLIEIVEFDEQADMAWTSITGLDQHLHAAELMESLGRHAHLLVVAHLFPNLLVP